MLRKITALSYLPVSAISQFVVDKDSVWITQSSDFLPLRIIRKNTAPNVTPKSSDAGDLYAISLSTKILHRSEALMVAVKKGCVLKVDTYDGNSYIYGTKSFPLFGTVVRNLASTAKDFTGFTLSLSGSQLHDCLLLHA